MKVKKRRQKGNNLPYMILFALIIFISALLAILMIQKNEAPQQTQAVVTDTSSIQTSSQNEERASTKEDTTVRLIGVGDNLIHEALYKQAQKRAGGEGYDFTYAYENVADIIQSADIASINQETVMADIYEPSAYPMFNSPTALGKHLEKIGFDVFNQANNHTIDKGEKGILSTIDFWSTQDAKLTGVYKNIEDYDNIRTITTNDITFSFIGMTQLTNGLNLPADSDIIVMRTSDGDKIRGRIKKAKGISDVVVVNVHWGEEYTHEPNQTQKAMAKQMIEWGADVILGHHPHVIQPVEYIERADGTRGIVAYSLGNFISAQDRAVRMIGGMLDLVITKSFEENKIEISSVGFVPIITHYGAGFADVRNYTLENYTAELASKHGVKAKDANFSLDYINNTVRSVIDGQFL
ncbi:MAG: CapA family protein [Oscillospiraceae bacterium]